jgi:hypothetical protein
MERNGVQNGSDFNVRSITVSKQVYMNSYDTLSQVHDYVQCNVTLVIIGGITASSHRTKLTIYRLHYCGALSHPAFTTHMCVYIVTNMNIR